MIELVLISILLNIGFFLYFEKFSKVFLLYDNPGEKRKIHKIKTSNAAGFVMAINSLIIFIYFYLDNELFNIYIFSLLFFIIGFLDDKNYLNPISKLLISAIIVYFSIKMNNDFLVQNLKIEALGIDINIGSYSVFFTILCVLLLLNALNMFDGINLQSGFYLLTIFSIFFSMNIFSEFSLMVLVSLIFFMYFNFKGKIFLGNSGVWFFSYFISHALISSFNKKVIDTEFILIILIFPGLDMFRVFLQRIINKKHPFYPDKIHIHHILLNSFNLFKTAIIIFMSYLIPILFFLISNDFIKSFSLLILIYLILFFKFYIIKNINKIS